MLLPETILVSQWTGINRSNMSSIYHGFRPSYALAIINTSDMIDLYNALSYRPITGWQVSLAWLLCHL